MLQYGSVKKIDLASTFVETLHATSLHTGNSHRSALTEPYCSMLAYLTKFRINFCSNP